MPGGGSYDEMFLLRPFQDCIGLEQEFVFVFS